jgi:hypothetical protein
MKTLAKSSQCGLAQGFPEGGMAVYGLGHLLKGSLKPHRQ